MSANRVAVYATAGVALVGGLLPVAANLDLSSTAGIIAAITVIGGVTIKWLGGWQNYETAAYQHQLIEAQAAARAEVEATAIQAAQQASGPRKPTINLPR